MKILEKDLIIRARGYFILYIYKIILNFAREKLQQREFLKDNMNNTNNRNLLALRAEIYKSYRLKRYAKSCASLPAEGGNNLLDL